MKKTSQEIFLEHKEMARVIIAYYLKINARFESYYLVDKVLENIPAYVTGSKKIEALLRVLIEEEREKIRFENLKEVSVGLTPDFTVKEYAKARGMKVVELYNKALEKNLGKRAIKPEDWEDITKKINQEFPKTDGGVFTSLSIKGIYRNFKNYREIQIK